jgi:dATP pyrophosphohydrolase
MNQRQFKRPESVLVLVYTKDADVLLLRRQHPPDFWQSVTGSLEWGEAPREAAHRELREETGLDANNGLIDCAHRNIFEILPAWRHRYAPGTPRNIEYVYRIEYPQPPEIQLNHLEHKEFVWLPRDQALGRVTSWTNREGIERFVPEPHI